MAELLKPGLWRLRIALEGNPLKNLNSYLFTGEDRCLLIDTGFRQKSCRESLLAQLDEIGVDRSKMDIFVTHLHSDHVGNAPEIISPSSHIWISETDYRVLLDNRREEFWPSTYENYIHNGFSRQEIEELHETNPAQKLAPVELGTQFRFISDGDVLEYGYYSLKCVQTPGHTPGHMCLYEEKHHWLFSGDCILMDITPNITSWKYLDDALGSYLDSLEHLNELEISEIFPAHRERTGSVYERIAELKAHHEARLENCYEIVRKSSGQTAYQIAGKMQWQIRARNWSEFPLNQKFFAVGEAMSHLGYLEKRGKVMKYEDGDVIRYKAVE